MSFSFTSFIRLVIFSAMGLNVVAVLLGRLGPPPRPTSWSFEPSPRYAWIDGKDLEPMSPPILHDLVSDRPDRLDQADGDQFHHGGCSPWIDQDGACQVVGLKVSFDPDVDGRRATLERLSYPSGRVLDRLDLDQIPTGPPCWYADSPDRILFGSGDGMIYHLAFSSSADYLGGSRAGKRHPRPLTWKTPPPGYGPVVMRNPSRPSDPRWGDRFLVSLSVMEQPDANRLGSERIWWIRLDPQGTAIVAAGPLEESDPTRVDPLIVERKSPVSASFEGRPVLAYLLRGQNRDDWQLTLSEVDFESESSGPRIRTESTRILADRCGITPPIFSGDGRWLSCVVDRRTPRARLARFSVEEALGRAESEVPSPGEADSLSLVGIDPGR